MVETKMFSGLKSEGFPLSMSVPTISGLLDRLNRCGLDRISPAGRNLQEAPQGSYIRQKGFGSTIRRGAVLESFLSIPEPDKTDPRATMSLRHRG